MLQILSRLLLASLLLLAWPAMADVDPPGRVGRLGAFENEVIFRVDRNDRGEAATTNWPISSGALLETGRRGRAEAWVGSSAYRLADDSQLEFTAIDDSRVWLRLSGGTLAVSILDRDQADDVVVATPDGDIRFQTPGRYRIDVLGDHSSLTVQAGRALFEAGGRVMPVAAGQTGSRWSDGRERLDAAWSQDAFDTWVASRENATLAGPARRHVSPYMTGYADLDAYGDWQTAADYGTVWYPRAVAADWAPYRYGRWAWVAPWGWTWIDAAPWGFAPFHYGRWAIIGGRWGWVPGRIVPRPVYAPALVAWIGNPGWSVSFGFGAAPAVGWFPLAPREVYVPAYRYSPTYIRQINVTHIHDVQVIERAARPDFRERYAYRDMARAVTVVPTQTLREGRPIARDDIRHPERHELGRAPLAQKAPGAEWVAPPPRMQRQPDEERRPLAERPRREGDARPPLRGDRQAGRPGPEILDLERRDTSRQPDNGRFTETPRRDVPPDASRERPAMRAPDMPGRREPAPAVQDGPRERINRHFERQPGASDTERPPPPVRRDVTPPEARSAGPQILRDAGEDRRRPVDARPGGEPPRSPLMEQAPAPRPREMPAADLRREERPQPVPPQLAPRREMPLPEIRREERPQPIEREQRREMRDFQRQERPAPPPQAMPPRELPRAMPEARMPAPQPAPRMEAPRIEAPRQPSPSPGGHEQRRNRDDEHGPR